MKKRSKIILAAVGLVLAAYLAYDPSPITDFVEGFRDGYKAADKR